MNIPEGQLTQIEKDYLFEVVQDVKPNVVLESGTWKGGGSTLSITKSLHKNGHGILHTFEEHTPFFNIANDFYSQSEYKNNIVLYNKSIIDGLNSMSNQFFESIDVIFLDGGDENSMGLLKKNIIEYQTNYNISENVQSFKILEQKIKSGTIILLHDWSVSDGRGNFIKRYLEDKNFINFEFLNLISASTGLAHLIKK